MSKSSSAKLTFFLLTAAFVAVALCTSDLPSVLAQNTNSSTTMSESDMQNSNTNGNMGRRRGSSRRSGRRGSSRRRNTNMNANSSDDTNMSGNENMSGDNTNMMQDNSNMSGDAQDNTNMGTARRGGRRGSRRSGRRGGTTSDSTDATTTGDTTTTTGGQTGDMTTDTSGGASADLSGTYTGKVSMPDHGVTNEEGTLTVTGNQYTLTAGSMTHSGRIFANTTRGYTGVAMELGPGEAGKPAQYISLRARRSGAEGLTLMSVPGEKHKFSFMSAGMSGGGRRRGRR